MGSTWGNLGSTDDGSLTSGSFSYPALLALQHSNASTLLTIVGFKPIGRLTAIIDGKAELVEGELVSGGFYDTVGVRPVRGSPDSAIRRCTERGANGRGDQRRVLGASIRPRSGRSSAARFRSTRYPSPSSGSTRASFTGLQPGRRPDVFVPLNMQPVILPWRYGKNPSLLDDPDYWWVLAMGRLHRERMSGRRRPRSTLRWVTPSGHC